jgi:hypothetical protein
VRLALSFVVVAILAMSVVKLSCVASELPVAESSMPASLFTDALEPELPITSEVEQVDPVAIPTLTR